jgi:hypothetical protein
LGDSVYFGGLKEIGSVFDINLVVINLGSYGQRWMMAENHLSPEEAVGGI